MSLTDTKVKNLKPKEKVYRVSDDMGLCIEVKPTGVKLWRYRFMVNGKASMISLGEYPSVGLAEARTKRDVFRIDVLAGRSPVAVKREEVQAEIAKAENTFRIIYLEWLDKRMSAKSDGYLTNIKRAMDNDILPFIGDKAISVISSADVLKIINRIIDRVRDDHPGHKRATGECTAIAARQYISGVFQYAIQTLRAENDPTYALRRTVERPEVHHARDLSEQEILKLLSALKRYGGTTTVTNAVLFMMLTMVRTKEIRNARWKDIDFKNGLWVVEAMIMKKRRTHWVPLSKQAIDILIEQQSICGDKEFCFSSPQRKPQPISGQTVNRALEYMNMTETTGHDFRATASTIMNAKGFNSDWIEKQLSHVEADMTRRTYNHADYIGDRRKMLDWWAGYIDELQEQLKAVSQPPDKN